MFYSQLISKDYPGLMYNKLACMEVRYQFRFEGEVTSCFCFQPNQIRAPTLSPMGVFFFSAGSGKMDKPISFNIGPRQPVTRSKISIHYISQSQIIFWLVHCGIFLSQSAVRAHATQTRKVVSGFFSLGHLCVWGHRGCYSVCVGRKCNCSV